MLNFLHNQFDNNNTPVMEALKAIIIDDEAHGRNNLHNLLKDYCPEIQVIRKTGDPSEAKSFIYDLNPDVVFLDIKMPKVSGFELIDSLSERNFLLVFVTAHSEFGIQAVKANAVDYLLKPVDINELQQCVKKLLVLNKNKNKVNPDSKTHEMKNKLLVSHNEGTNLIEFKDIIWFEGDNNYTKIHLANQKPLIVAKTLKEFENSLPENIFFRIHKSEIINLGFVSEYSTHDGGFLKLKTGERLDISRRRFLDFAKSIKKFTEDNPER